MTCTVVGVGVTCTVVGIGVTCTVVKCWSDLYCSQVLE